MKASKRMSHCSKSLRQEKKKKKDKTVMSRSGIKVTPVQKIVGMKPN